MNLSSIIDLKEKHKKFFISHKNESVEIRIRFLKKLKKELLAKENNIYDALYNDLKKPVFEAYTSEFLMVQKEIEIFIKYLKPPIYILPKWNWCCVKNKFIIIFNV